LPALDDIVWFTQHLLDPGLRVAVFYRCKARFQTEVMANDPNCQDYWQ